MSGLRYEQYDAAKEAESVAAMRELIAGDLSEPYSIYVYRYFLYSWGDLCYLALDGSMLVGAIVCKLEPHRSGPRRGYIAMLAVRTPYRGRGIGSVLVRLAVDAMAARAADEVVLETETDNGAAIALYERLGFRRSKRLHRYYLNGNDAYRLVLYLREGVALVPTIDPYQMPAEFLGDAKAQIV